MCLYATWGNVILLWRYSPVQDQMSLLTPPYIYTLWEPSSMLENQRHWKNEDPLEYSVKHLWAFRKYPSPSAQAKSSTACTEQCYSGVCGWYSRDVIFPSVWMSPSPQSSPGSPATTALHFSPQSVPSHLPPILLLAMAKWMRISFLLQSGNI